MTLVWQRKEARPKQKFGWSQSENLIGLLKLPPEALKLFADLGDLTL